MSSRQTTKTESKKNRSFQLNIDDNLYSFGTADSNEDASANHNKYVNEFILAEHYLQRLRIIKSNEISMEKNNKCIKLFDEISKIEEEIKKSSGPKKRKFDNLIKYNQSFNPLVDAKLNLEKEIEKCELEIKIKYNIMINAYHVIYLYIRYLYSKTESEQEITKKNFKKLNDLIYNFMKEFPNCLEQFTRENSRKKAKQHIDIITFNLNYKSSESQEELIKKIKNIRRSLKYKKRKDMILNKKN